MSSVGGNRLRDSQHGLTVILYLDGKSKWKVDGPFLRKVKGSVESQSCRPSVSCVSCGSGWSVPCVSIQLTLSQQETGGTVDKPRTHDKQRRIQAGFHTRVPCVTTTCRPMYRYPCRMPPYSHADIPFKSPHRNSGGPANRQVAWSVTNLSLSVSLYTMVTDSYQIMYQIQPSCERES